MLHNSLFLVAHFHNVIIGGVLFGGFAGYTFWFPKAFGFRLHEGLGKAAFWCWIVGFYVAFMPLYVLGLMGMTRRMQHYDVPAWHPWLLVAAVGAAIIMAGIILQVVQLVVSIRQRDALRDETGDPWDGRSLEWATASPPPAFNFAVLPNVEGEEAYWGIKQRAREQAAPSEEPEYSEIEMPKNSPTGVVCAFFATIMGFALIWHIWWMVAVAAVGAYATFVVFAWRNEVEYVVPVEEVAPHRPGEPHQPDARPGSIAARVVTMSQAAAGPNATAHGHRSGEHPAQHAELDKASKRIVVGYGFWIFLLSDIIMFAAFFATYAVLSNATAGGPSGHELFDLRSVAVETACLLLSSFTCGIASIGAWARKRSWFYLGMALTFVLGAAFLGLELREFTGLIERGAGPTRSAFLSAFFTLVGCHGLHVTCGLLWLLTMVAQVFLRGYRPKSCGVCCASACSGMRWTSCGSRCSRLFT